MVQKFQWNILENQMQKIIHKNIISILKESPKNKLPLNDLINLLNKKTNHLKIHNNKKYNSTSKYIKYQYNGITKFLDDYNIYGIIKKSDEIKVVLIEDLLEDFDIINPPKRITRDNEWVFI